MYLLLPLTKGHLSNVVTICCQLAGPLLERAKSQNILKPKYLQWIVFDDGCLCFKQHETNVLVTSERLSESCKSFWSSEINLSGCRSGLLSFSWYVIRGRWWHKPNQTNDQPHFSLGRSLTSPVYKQQRLWTQTRNLFHQCSIDQSWAVNLPV